jgi:hypothetical protein
MLLNLHAIPPYILLPPAHGMKVAIHVICRSESPQLLNVPADTAADTDGKAWLAKEAASLGYSTHTSAFVEVCTVCPGYEVGNGQVCDCSGPVCTHSFPLYSISST